MTASSTATPVPTKRRRATAARQNLTGWLFVGPFGSFYYASFTEELAAINNGEKTGSQAADDLQAKLVAYAEEQGFTVTE